MEVLRYCKTQIACLVILLLIGCIYIRDSTLLNKRANRHLCNQLFDALLIMADIALVFDAATAYTVNKLDVIPAHWNMILHLIYMLSFQFFICLHFTYMLTLTERLPRKPLQCILLYVPQAIAAVIAVMYIPQVNYCEGVYTNYARGISATASFMSIGIYFIFTMIVFLRSIRFIEHEKKSVFTICLLVELVLLLLQITFGELLLSSLAVTLIIVSIYLTMENPSTKYLEVYHEEMVSGFATLVENHDDSTGEHIKRTTAYVELILRALKRDSRYKSLLTKDYVRSVKKAAPMHDVGKIGIPDRVLQKPGRLTPEEFEIMKQHPVIGGNIVKETFGKLDDAEYEEIAYQVTRYHHEKWNGKGYPEGLEGEEIPLCARIMAVADVFDALSSKRCYRDALPLSTCFEIIKEGSGVDFDPTIAELFCRNKAAVLRIFESTKGQS